MKQGIHVQSATQKYPVGQRIKLGDRVFHYCRAEEALYQHWGAQNADPLHEQNTAVIASAGDLDLTIVEGSATLDQFKDGYINVWTTVKQIHLRIKGNDASDGVNTVLHLADPLLYDVAAGTFTGVKANMYNYVGSGGIGVSKPLRSTVCVPLINVTAGYFFWGQTEGPTMGTAHTGSGQGSGAAQRQVVFCDDGSIDIPSRATGTTDAQYAGYLLSDTTIGNDINYYLKLAA